MVQSKLTTFFKSAANNDKCFTRSYETRYVTYLKQTITIAVLMKKRVEVNTKKVTVLPVLSVSVFLVP